MKHARSSETPPRQVPHPHSRFGIGTDDMGPAKKRKIASVSDDGIDPRVPDKKDRQASEAVWANRICMNTIMTEVIRADGTASEIAAVSAAWHDHLQSEAASILQQPAKALARRAACALSRELPAGQPFPHPWARSHDRRSVWPVEAPPLKVSSPVERALVQLSYAKNMVSAHKHVAGFRDAMCAPDMAHALHGFMPKIFGSTSSQPLVGVDAVRSRRNFPSDLREFTSPVMGGFLDGVAPVPYLSCVVAADVDEDMPVQFFSLTLRFERFAASVPIYMRSKAVLLTSHLATSLTPLQDPSFLDMFCAQGTPPLEDLSGIQVDREDRYNDDKLLRLSDFMTRLMLHERVSALPYFNVRWMPEIHDVIRTGEVREVRLEDALVDGFVVGGVEDRPVVCGLTDAADGSRSYRSSWSYRLASQQELTAAWGDGIERPLPAPAL
jgi:hypothetical protein